MNHHLITLTAGLALASAQAQPPAAGPSKGPVVKPVPLDRQVASALHDILTHGAGIYNHGDSAGCCRFFEGALRTVRPLLDHRAASQKAIDAALARAEQAAKTEDRAFLLREALDHLMSELSPPKPGEKLPAKPQETGFTVSGEEKELLELTNKEREKQGLLALKPDEKLFQAARVYSANMAKQRRLDHGLDGRGFGERLADVGYAHAGWGENVAAGQRTPADAIASWMNSAGHRANILNGRFTEVGLGLAADGHGGAYWTQVFATPAAR